MTHQATGAFTIDTGEDEPFGEQDGVKLSRVRVTKTFAGEIAVSSTTALVMAGAQEGSAAYVGLEQVVASVRGHSGSFVLQHSATMTKDAQSLSLTVVPDSGTGELLGISGQARIEIDAEGGHRLILDYELG
jgi:predicted flavoprotein YhiN